MNKINLAERFDRIGKALIRYDEAYGHLSFPIEERCALEEEFKMHSLLGTQYQNQYVKNWIDFLIQTIVVRNLKCKMK